MFLRRSAEVTRLAARPETCSTQTHVLQLPKLEEWLADLARRLKEHDVPLLAVADEMGIHASQLSRWIHGKVEPRLSTMHKIDEAVAKVVEKRAAEIL